MTGVRPAIVIGAAVVFTVLGATPCAADDVPVVNPGFEDISGEDPFNEFTFGPLNGWDLYDPDDITQGGAGPVFFIGTLTPFEEDPEGNPGVYVFFPDGAPEGERVGIAFNFAGSGDTGAYGFVQELKAVLEPRTAYTLEVEIGNIASGVARSGEYFDLDGFPGYRIDLLAGGEVLAQDDNTLGGLIPEGEFATSTVTFETGPEHEQIGQPLAIRLVNINVIDPESPEANLEVDFDDVRLCAVPTKCEGDIVPDGNVGFADLLALLGCWSPGGPVPPGCAGADLDDDGEVGFTDLLLLLGLWGACP